METGEGNEVKKAEEKSDSRDKGKHGTWETCTILYKLSKRTKSLEAFKERRGPRSKDSRHYERPTLCTSFLLQSQQSLCSDQYLIRRDQI